MRRLLASWRAGRPGTSRALSWAACLFAAVVVIDVILLLYDLKLAVELITPRSFLRPFVMTVLAAAALAVATLWRSTRSDDARHRSDGAA